MDGAGLPPQVEQAGSGEHSRRDGPRRSQAELPSTLNLASVRKLLPVVMVAELANKYWVRRRSIDRIVDEVGRGQGQRIAAHRAVFSEQLESCPPVTKLKLPLTVTSPLTTEITSWAAPAAIASAPTVKVSEPIPHCCCPAEAPPPDEQRFEIRLAGVGGGATLDSPTLGHFAAGADEACFYIDVLPGTTSDVVVHGDRGGQGRRHRAGARYRRVRPEGALVVRRHQRSLRGSGRQVQPRRRRRLERGGEEPQARPRRPLRVVGDLAPRPGTRRAASADRELGLFKDFTVKFTMEVKRFPTQWPPHAKECVPQVTGR